MNKELTTSSPLMESVLAEISQYIDPTASTDVREAQRLHYSFVSIGKLVVYASKALRDIAIEMYLSGGWASLVVTIDGGELRFSDFREWLNYATSIAGLSDTAESAMNNYIYFLVDPVSKGLIARPDGQVIEVEDIRDLREGHTRTLGSAARQLLSDPEDGARALGELITLAEDPTISQSDLLEEARARGLSRRRIPRAEARVVEFGERAIFVVTTTTEAQLLSIQSVLHDRVEWHTVTFADLGEYITMQRPGIDVEMLTEGGEAPQADEAEDDGADDLAASETGRQV